VRLPQLLLVGEGQRDHFAAARLVRVRLVALAAGAFLRGGVGFPTAGVGRCAFGAVVLAVSIAHVRQSSTDRYGPDYTAPENLDRLRDRGLGTKRSMALR
jgi:hypothetical protein